MSLYFKNSQFLKSFLYKNVWSRIKPSLYFNNFFKITILSLSTNKNLYKVQESSDPVIKKYRGFLLNIAKQRVEDVSYETNFGSIRFDSENCPEKSNDNFSNKEENLNKDDHIDIPSINYLDEIYFKDQLYEFNNSEITPHKKSKNSNNNSKEISKITELNYIDSQYLIQPEFINSNNLYNIKLPINYEADISDLNYLDSQYFNSIISQNEIPEKKNINLEFNEFLKKLKETEDEKRQTINITQTNQLKKPKPNNIKAFNFEDSLSENSEESIFEIKEDVNYSNLNKEQLGRLLLNISETVTGNKFKYQNEIEEEGSLSDESLNKENIASLDKTGDPPKVVIESETQRKGSSAYRYVIEKRKETINQNISQEVGDISQDERFKKILFLVPKFSTFTQHDMVKLLNWSIIYNKSKFIKLLINF